MDEGIGEQHQERDHQAVDRHRLDHGEADEQGRDMLFAASGWRAMASIAAATARPSPSAGPIAPNDTAIGSRDNADDLDPIHVACLSLLLTLRPSLTALAMKTMASTVKM